MTKKTTREALEGLITKEVNALKNVDLKRLDEQGARVYLLTDEDGDPEVHISWGNPIDSAPHEWTDQQPETKAYSEWEAWQESRTKPEELRVGLLQFLTDGLVPAYLDAVADAAASS